MTKATRFLMIDKKRYDLDSDFPHSNFECKGQFQIYLCSTQLTLEAIGPIQINKVPLMKCPECGIAHILPEFQEFIENALARELLSSPKALSRKALRFLRIVSGKTLEEVGKIFESDKSYASRYEREQDMPFEKQIILKSWYMPVFGFSTEEQAKITQSHIKQLLSIREKAKPNETKVNPLRASDVYPKISDEEIKRWINKNHIKTKTSPSHRLQMRSC